MGYCMLIYIAALQSISLEYYEAARVEGANVFHEFIHITLPMIVPAITSNVTLLLSWGLRCFDYSQMVINMKTAKTTAVFVYEYIFGNSRAGLGQAGAIILTLVLVILTIYGCRYAQSQSTGVTYSLGINRAAYSIPMIYCAASMLIGMIEKIYDSVVNYRQGKKEAA